MFYRTSSPLGPLPKNKGPMFDRLPNRSLKRHMVTSISLKRKMWSAIPIALLYMIVSWSEMKQGSFLEGDKVQ